MLLLSRFQHFLQEVYLVLALRVTPEDVAEGVVTGKYRLLFFTPETILNSRKWRHFIREKCADSLKTLVIDEAHTVKLR